MENNTANPIKEYYIAYFDILGYKAFFEESPEKAPEFLNTINSAITNIIGYVQTFNDSLIAFEVGNIHIQSQIFSDNILLCIEVGEDITKEKFRIITFMIEAVKMEESTSYPRIAVSDKVINFLY